MTFQEQLEYAQKRRDEIIRQYEELLEMEHVGKLIIIGWLAEADTFTHKVIFKHIKEKQERAAHGR